VQEVRPGVWHWTAHHPEWKEGEDWGPEVSSFAIDDGEHLLLFDPIAPSAFVDELAAARQPVVVLTCPWHRRDTAALVEGLGAKVYVPPPDEGDPDPVRGEVFEEGDTLPFGVRALPGMEPNDLVLWVESKRALVLGDTLMDRGDGRGLRFSRSWAEKGAIAARGVPPSEILERLLPLRELPVELVLATHGGPFDRDALDEALQA
jgi:glyoxylase-like metal-dependent hydrolase (beta-lactamase superfamily II)